MGGMLQVDSESGILSKHFPHRGRGWISVNWSKLLGFTEIQLQASMAEVKAAQSASQQLQQEVATYQDMFVKVTEIASEVGGYDSQIKSISAELLSKGAQLDKLANSFREVAAALKTVSRSTSSSH